jgi:hypothetical protein
MVKLTIEWDKRINNGEEGCLEVEEKNGILYILLKKYQNNNDCCFI